MQMGTMKELYRRLISSTWLYRAMRIALALLFLYAGGIKLLDPKAFARIISAYEIVPDALLPFVAVGLPVLEVLAGLALLFDIRGSLAVISGLLLLFVGVLGYGIIQDLDVDCGCFGAEELSRRDSLRHALYRDLVLVGMVVPYLYLSRRLRLRGELRPEKVTDNNKTV
jgi:hypothetical protein